MSRTGLVIALAVGAIAGVIFGVWPELDLKLASPFFDSARGGFWRSYDPLYLRARDGAVWLITLVALPAVVAPIVKLFRPQRPMLIPGRALLLFVLQPARTPQRARAAERSFQRVVQAVEEASLKSVRFGFD